MQVVATAGASYVLDHWTGNVTDHNAVTSMVVMDRDNTVTTYFSEMPPILGDVNGDEGVDSTGTLIIRSSDVDIATSPYCPMNCGDVNAGGASNSTAALVVLSTMWERTSRIRRETLDGHPVSQRVRAVFLAGVFRHVFFKYQGSI